MTLLTSEPKMSNCELRQAIQATFLQVNEKHLDVDIKQVIKDHLSALLGAEKHRATLEEPKQ